MSDTIKTIDLGQIVITATINGKPANLTAGDNFSVVVNGTVTIDLDKE